MAILLRAALISSLALAGCGGKVVFDVGGTGGAGGGSVSSTSASSHASASATQAVGATSTGSGSTCAALQAAMDQAILAAQACDPAISSPQCDGTAFVDDTCGCPSILLDEKDPAKVALAQKAYDAWTQAGCGPFPCGKACFPAGPGFCQPLAGLCTGPVPP